MSLSAETATLMSFKLSYLINVLVRSSKFISVLIGTILFKSDGHENFNNRSIVLAVIMTIGIFIFHMGGSKKHSVVTDIVGLILGVVSLASDYLVSKYQNGVRKMKLSYFDLMLGNNFWCLIITIGMGLVKSEFAASGAFIMEHPIALWDILESSVVKVVGIYFIFYHIYMFGPISLAYITTVRKVFTVILSFLIFRHTLGPLRVIGITIVFTIIAIDLYDNIMKKKKEERGGKVKAD